MTNKKVNEGDKYRCRECGSDKVQTKAWVYPNDDNEFVEYVGTNSDEEDNYCEECDTCVEVMFQDELICEIDDWLLELSISLQEQVTGLSGKDYATEKEFTEAIQAYWQGITDEEKIKEWNSYNNN